MGAASLLDALEQYVGPVGYERWAADVYRIRDKHGQIVPLRLTPAQRLVGVAEHEELTRHGTARLLVLKGRQGGITTDQQARSLHQIWHDPGFDALTLAHTTEDTDKIFAITRRALEHWADDPQIAPLLPKRGEKMANQVEFPDLDSLLFTGTAGSKRTGRGLTLKRFHGSEFAFWEHPRDVLKGVTPALVPNGSSAILETTASGVGSEAHTFWMEAERGGSVWRPVFIPWWECDPRNYRRPLDEPDELGALEDDERRLVERHGLTLEQIKWRRYKIREMGRKDFRQEYAEDPASCWAAQGGMFYDSDTLDALAGHAAAPVATHLNGQLRVYRETLPTGYRAIIGSDTSAGGGGAADRQTFAAWALKLDAGTDGPAWVRLATFGSPDLTPEGLADLLNEWGRRYAHPRLGAALIVVERNAHGVTTLRKLRDKHEYPIARLYHSRTESATHPTRSRSLGWQTTASTKPLMLDAARELFRAGLEGDADAPDGPSIADARGVVWKDGKVDLNGRDALVADMLAWVGRTYPLYTGSTDPDDWGTVTR